MSSGSVKLVDSVRDDIALRKDRLQILRERHGWSRRQLSLLCGLGTNQINKYEKGEIDPSSTHLKIIAEKLGVSTDYLLGLSDDPRGQLGDTELNEQERAVLEVLRRDGWVGVIHLAADRLTK
jgi:transcriptional regulator with XRE-family HTH domain